MSDSKNWSLRKKLTLPLTHQNHLIFLLLKFIIVQIGHPEAVGNLAPIENARFAMNDHEIDNIRFEIKYSSTSMRIGLDTIISVELGPSNE